jgi:hypothetical protein
MFIKGGVQLNNFVDLTTAFLESFAPARTDRTATVKLHEVKQQSSEGVVEFYACVISIIDKLELLLPAAARHPAAVTMPQQIVTLAGYNKLHVAIRGTVLTIFDLGITTALNHVANQLFVAGLKPAI